MTRLPFQMPISSIDESDPSSIIHGMLRQYRHPQSFEPTFGGILPQQSRQASGKSQDFAPTDKEEQDLRNEGWLGQGMGLLQGIGNVLDAPGGFVRTGLYNALVGDSGASAGDAFLDPSKRKYGSDFLDAAGWTAPENWTGEDVGETVSNSAQKLAHGIAGFGLDVVTDPLSLIGIGGKTAQGLARVAKAGETAARVTELARAGKTGATTAAMMAGELAPAADTISGGIRAGDRAALNIHAPWWVPGSRKMDPLLSIGSGDTMLGNAAANTIDKLSYGRLNPLALARGLLDPRVKDTFNPEKQKLMDLDHIRVQNELGNAKDASRIFQQSYAPMAERVQAIVKHHIENADPKFADELLRGIQTDEKLRDSGAVLGNMEAKLQEAAQAKGAVVSNPVTPGVLTSNPSQDLQELTNRMIDFHTNIQKSQNWAYKVWEDAGGKAPELQDMFAAHAFRSSSLARSEQQYAKNAKRFGYEKTEYDARPEIGRNDATRHNPGSEPVINAKAKDPLLMGYDTTGVTPPLEMDPAANKAALEAATGKVGAGLSLEQLRRIYSWEKYDKPAIEASFASQIDPATGLMRKATDTYRNSYGLNLYSDGKIIPDPETGKFQDWVRHINDGDPELQRAVDFYDTMKQWNPWNPANGALIGDAEHPIDKVLHFLDGFGPEKLKQGIYDQNIAVDHANYMGSLIERAATLRTAQVWLGRAGVVAPMAAGTIKNGVPLSQAWEQSSLNPGGMEAFIKQHKDFGPEYAQKLKAATDQALADKAATTPGFNVTDPANIAEYTANVKPGVLSDVAGGIAVHPRAVKGLQAYADLAEAANNSHKPGPILNLIDRFNTLWKTLQYNIWPPSHIRDIASRVTNSALDGRAPLIDILGGTREGVKYLINSAKVSPETTAAVKRFHDLKVFRPYMAMDIGGGAPSAAANTMPWYKRMGRIPGAISKEEVEKGNLNPLVALGYKAQYWGDFAGQFGHFRALEKAGYTGEQIAQIIRETHYTNELSPFEKTFLFRVVPFERFTTRNIPHQLAAIFSEPGGRTAEMVRALTEKSAEAQKDTYVPEWMREQTVYPAGRNEKGEQGYYRNTLAPQHELSDITIGKGLLGDLLSTGGKFAAKATPPLTWALENFGSDEGTQLETGRKIGDLESPLSNIASGYAGRPVDMRLLEKIIHYATPFPRLESQVGVPLLERIVPHIPGAAGEPTRMHGSLPQFLTNMLGLGKVGYHNDARWKALDEQHAIEEKVQQGGARPWTNFELPKRAAAQMTPQQVQAIHALLQRRVGLSDYMKNQAAQGWPQQALPAGAGQPTL